MNFREIDEARRLLELGETATLAEIKAAYRRLAHLHHPDKNNGAVADKTDIMKRLNQAYKLLMDYCAGYQYSFRQEDITRMYPQEENWNKWRDNWGF